MLTGILCRKLPTTSVLSFQELEEGRKSTGKISSLISIAHRSVYTIKYFIKDIVCELSN